MILESSLGKFVKMVIHRSSILHIFLVFDKDQEKEMIIRFNEDDTVSLHEDITNLILRVSLEVSDQAGTTLMYLCQKLANSTSVHVSSPFCRSGTKYRNWLLDNKLIKSMEEAPDYLSYDEAVTGYNLYDNTEKAKLSEYVQRPKIGNIYKFKLVCVEAMKIKRLKKIRTSEKNTCDVTMLSATFSQMLINECDIPLIVERCQEVENRTNFMRVFENFASSESLHAQFSPLSLKTEENSYMPGMSRWFCDLV